MSYRFHPGHYPGKDGFQRTKGARYGWGFLRSHTRDRRRARWIESCVYASRVLRQDIQRWGRGSVPDYRAAFKRARLEWLRAGIELGDVAA